MLYAKRISFLIITFIFVYFIYSVSLLMLKFGFNGASGEFFFVILGIYLIIPIAKYSKIRKEVIEGKFEEDRKVNKNLKKVKCDSVPLDGVKVKFNDEEVLIDNLVITKKGVFNIVKCDYKGDIIIKENNRWLKKYHKYEKAIPCPVVTIRKNREVLSTVFKEEQIIDLIVMVKDRVYVEDEELSDVPIIRYDELKDFIEDCEEEEKWNTSELYDKLYSIIVSTKNLKEEKKVYEDFLDYKWIFRSRLTFISVFYILYFLNLIYVYR